MRQTPAPPGTALPVNNSPAELVAIARAARIAGDRELERAARGELRDRFGIALTFHNAAATVEGGAA